MKTANQKAEELLDKFNIGIGGNSAYRTRVAKQLALTCVDEIIDVCESGSIPNIEMVNYYDQVKTEIQNL